jgi:hypothetical protein
MAAMAMPIGRAETKKLAWEIDLIHSVPFFDAEKGPSDGWLAGFLSRNPQIALRTPSHIDGGRATMARKSTISKYFDLLSSPYLELQLDGAPHRIYNIDETGFNREPK